MSNTFAPTPSTDVAHQTEMLDETQERIFYDILEDIKREESLELSSDDYADVTTSDEESCENEVRTSDADDTLDDSEADDILNDSVSSNETSDEEVFGSERDKTRPSCGGNSLENKKSIKVLKLKQLLNSQYSDTTNIDQYVLPVNNNLSFQKSIYMDENGIIRIKELSKSPNNVDIDYIHTDKSQSASHFMKKVSNSSLSSPEYACELCVENFKTRIRLLRHLSKHYDTIPTRNGVIYSCHVCRKKFVQKQNFNLHLAVHTGQKTYICKYCGSTYYLKGSYNCHLRKQHSDVVNRNKCLVFRCSGIYSSAKFRHTHLRHKCSACQKEMVFKKRQKFHAKIPTKFGSDDGDAVQKKNDKPITNMVGDIIKPCLSLGIRNSQEKSKVKVDEAVVCQNTEHDGECIGKTESDATENTEQKLVTKRTESTGTSLGNSDSVRENIGEGAQDKKVTVETPTDSMQRKIFAEGREIIVKQITREFACKFCEMTFTTTLEKKKHERNEHKHSVKLSQKNTDTAKNAAFKQSKSSLGSKIDSQLTSVAKDDKKITTLNQCSVCSETFSSRLLLAKHTKEHHVNLFKCSICDKMLKSKRTLSEHVKYVHFSKHKCKICKKHFVRRKPLLQHMERWHQTTLH